VFILYSPNLIVVAGIEDQGKRMELLITDPTDLNRDVLKVYLRLNVGQVQTTTTARYLSLTYYCAYDWLTR
jgi:hypothetical protein